jgi:hypothetical protein
VHIEVIHLPVQSGILHSGVRFCHDGRCEAIIQTGLEGDEVSGGRNFPQAQNFRVGEIGSLSALGILAFTPFSFLIGVARLKLKKMLHIRNQNMSWQYD